MSTAIPSACAASAATKRLSWSWTMKRMKTSAAMPVTTARKAFTLGGCRRTHDVTAPSGRFVPLIASPLGRLAFAPPPPPVEEHRSVFLLLFFLRYLFSLSSRESIIWWGRRRDRGGVSAALVIWPFCRLEWEARGVNVRPVPWEILALHSSMFCLKFYISMATYLQIIVLFSWHIQFSIDSWFPPDKMVWQKKEVPT